MNLLDQEMKLEVSPAHVIYRSVLSMEMRGYFDQYNDHILCGIQEVWAKRRGNEFNLNLQKIASVTFNGTDPFPDLAYSVTAVFYQH